MCNVNKKLPESGVCEKTIIDGSSNITYLEEKIGDLIGYLDSIVDSVPGSIYWKDINGIYLGCNNAMVKKSNFKNKDDIIGKTDSQLWSNYAEEICCSDKEVMMQDKTMEFQELVRIHTGECFYFASIKTPLKDRNGNIIGVVGNSLDITDRKRAEELKAKNDAAEKSSKFMAMLAGSVAHELRTPLSIININADLLEKTLGERGESSITDPITNIKETIKSAVHTVDHILVTLRTMSSPNVVATDKFKILSIADDIEKTLMIYPFQEEEKELVNLDKTTSFNYRGDSILTGNVLFNLIKNALYAIQKAGKGCVTISFKVGNKTNQVIFTDTAAEMKAGYISKLFDQFETQGALGVGTGLGLAFCRMVLRSYGGDISCEAEEGVYTRFVLTFPKVDNQTNESKDA